MHTPPHPSSTVSRRPVRRLAATALVVACAVGVAVPGAADAGERTVTVQRAVGDLGPFATPTELVQQVHVDILRRQPTSQEVANAVTAIEAGLAPEDYIAGLVGSAEADHYIKSIIRLYRAYYLRNPDHYGLGYWILQARAGSTLSRISNEFAKAPEFAVRYGRLDDGQFVDLIYSNVLDRLPDAKGRAYWMERMGMGLYRGQLMTSFSDSPEYKSKTVGLSAAITLYGGMYQVSLNRGLADSLGPQLQNGTITVSELARQYLDDPKYAARFS